MLVETFIGRFLMIIPMLGIAGNLARKKYVPPSLGTFYTPLAASTSPAYVVVMMQNYNRIAATLVKASRSLP